MNAQEFIDTYHVSMKLNEIDERTDGVTPPSPKHRHFEVTLMRCAPNGTYTYAYNIVYSGRNEPTLVDVLEATQSDISAFEGCEDLADFLLGFGYVSADDNKNIAKRLRAGIVAYGACQSTMDEMKKLLTGDDFDDDDDTLFQAFMNIDEF